MKIKLYVKVNQFEYLSTTISNKVNEDIEKKETISKESKSVDKLKQGYRKPNLTMNYVPVISGCWMGGISRGWNSEKERCYE